jgi:type IV secretion system protein VirB10
MAENIFAPQTEAHGGPQFEPELRHTTNEPKGVLQKNLKTFVYLGAALLVIVAAIFSSTGKKTPAQQAAQKGQPPQPTLQDNTDNNVQDLKNQLQAQRQKEQQQAALVATTGGDPALASATSAQRTAASAYGPTGVAAPCIAGQPCPQQQPGYGQQGSGEKQLSPEQQQAQQIAAKERARADDARFASNLAYSRSFDQPQGPGQMSPARQQQADSSLVTPSISTSFTVSTRSERKG